MVSELERTLDKLFPLSREQPKLQHLDCSETIGGRHGEPNVDGHCKWCGKKIASRDYFKPDKNSISTLQIYYDYMYNPDFGTSNWLERY